MLAARLLLLAVVSLQPAGPLLAEAFKAALREVGPGLEEDLETWRTGEGPLLAGIEVVGAVEDASGNGWFSWGVHVNS